MRGLHSKTEKDAIAAWRQDLHGVLLIFNVGSGRSRWAITELPLQAGVSMSNYVMLLDLYRSALAGRGPTDNKNQLVSMNHYTLTTIH